MDGNGRQENFRKNNRDKPWRKNRNEEWEDDRERYNGVSQYERERTREKQHNKSQRYEEKTWKHDKYNKYYNNRDKRDWYNNQVQVREIHPLAVEPPKEFIINENPEFIDPALPKFQLNIVKSAEPPLKEQNKLDELKNRITPIERIWTSHIKQYLNDSEFVEIHRKGKSLSYGKVEYGKTMIKYDEGDKSMQYENDSAQSKIFSRAYFKLWEILSLGVFEGKEEQEIKIASVAEGPGGFIHAMIDYRLKHGKQMDSFYGITLKIDENTRNAKDWSDFRAKTFFDSMRGIGYKIKLSYGATQTGDLLVQQNADHFADKDLNGEKCYLVTGDGGIECKGDKEFDYQEVFNVKLFLGEILAALKVQEKGGKFILKIYDCSFSLTRQLLTLLCVFYRKVRMIKPVTSRPGNSEKYMLCEDFLGMSDWEQKQLKQLLRTWAKVEPDVTYFQNSEFVTNILSFPNFKQEQAIEKSLIKANNYFMEEQSDKLEEGLKLAEDNENDPENIELILKGTRFTEQMSYAYEWCNKYGLTPIKVKMVEAGKKQEE